MTRVLSATVAGLLCLGAAACASAGAPPSQARMFDPMGGEVARTPSSRPTAVASMSPIPNPGATPSRRSGRRGFDRSEWERSNGVNGTLRPYTVAGVTYRPRHDPDYEEEGVASWYGPGFEGRRTASGEVFNGAQATAAHRTLRMGSIIEVTNLDSGQTARLRVNDRGPFHSNRILDVSREGARQLGLLGRGSGRVRVRYAGDGTEDRPLLARAAEGIADVVTAPVRLAVDVATAPVRLAAAAFSHDGDTDATWAVQGGAFSDRANAERLAARLSDLGDTRIRETDGGGRTLYRVLVGSWSDPNQASQAATRVASLGVADARVVRGL
jgi:rare lipoprotein A